MGKEVFERNNTAAAADPMPGGDCGKTFNNKEEVEDTQKHAVLVLGVC